MLRLSEKHEVNTSVGTKPMDDNVESTLRAVIQDIFWMARRYANGRKTYAPDTVNRALGELQRIGIEIDDDHTLVEDGNSSTKWLDTH